MIKIFSKTDKNFISNGDEVLLPFKAKVRKEDNNDFYLDIECPLKYVDYFVEGNIIVASTPQGEQAFRINNPEKTKSKVSCKAYHVFYDSKNYAIADTYIVNKNCNDALAQLNSHTDSTSPFSTLSNVTTVDSFRCVRKSLYEAIQTVLERWGGHLVRDNFSIQILSSIGQDNGVVVRYKKNLKEITCSENWDDVVTKILPVGRDGILLNDLDASQSIYILSSTQYDIPYTKVVEFNQDIDEQDYPSETAYKQALVTDLRTQATAYLAENCIPKVNYTLKANLEKITDVGDTVQVYDERLGINITTQVIAFTYDCISGQYSEVEFGNFQKTLSNLMSTITADTQSIANQTSKEYTDPIWSTLEDSYVFYDGTKILAVNTLPKENAQKVLKISSDGIGFSQNGINGNYNSSWDMNGALKPKNDLALEDYIIAQGESNDWTYIKYANGAVELWKKQTLNSLSWSSYLSYEDASAQTVDLLFSASKSIDLPFDIAGAIATVQVAGSTVAWVTNVQEQTDSVTIGLVSDTQSSSLTVNVHVYGAIE